MFVWAGFGLLGCLEGQWSESDELLESEETAAQDPDSCPATRPLATLYSIEAEPEDVALCRAQASREQECFEDCPATVDVDACANRYACSRQLWRQEIVAEVYDCIAERPCSDRDPAASCLASVSAEHEPSAAQLAFDDQLERTTEQCGDLVSVTPGQSDVVYDALARCMSANDSCDSKSSCAMITLGMLVEQACGTTEAI